MDKKRVPVNLTISQEILESFDEVAREENRSRQAHIVHLIKKEVREYERKCEQEIGERSK